MHDRIYVPGLHTKNIEHTNPVTARGDLRQGADANVVLEFAYTLLMHTPAPENSTFRSKT